jgi:threonine dehydrogenase-like Zn-dependent dehydrogenase
MKAAYLLDRRISVGELDDPEPLTGEVLVRTLACGVCASDLHLVHHAERLMDWSRAFDGPFQMDLERPVVLGHEFVGEIVDYGPGTERKFKSGTRVTSVPVVTRAGSLAAIGHANHLPGGFGEYMILSGEMIRPLPESLGTDLAAMSEPVSVGIYYVRAARLTKDDVPLVIGCGAIGLAMIMALKLTQARPIIAADFSASRRQLALAMGADIVVDPKEVSPYLAPAGFEGRVPNVVFECVGVPGVLDSIMRSVAAGARIVVAGWCLETDHIFSPSAHTKGLSVQFGGGPRPEDFDAALRALGEGQIDPTPWLGDRVGLSGVAGALEAMRDPANPIRTIVEPARS